MKKLITIILFLFLITGIEINSQTFTSSNLPIIVINTHGLEIPNAEKITADLGIIYNGDGVRNYLTDPFNNYSGKIGIEIRGSSSQMYPKKQYAVETRDINGEDSAASLLGFPKESDWILSAPYSDKTLLRDVLVYKWANEMGRYASRSKFCEVVLNGNYMGVYILLEKIKRDKNRVNISKIDSSAVSGENLTGGYIIKIDKYDGENNSSWFSQFPPYPGSSKKIRYIYHYPKPDEITQIQKNYIQSYVYAFESAINSNYSDTVNGYPKLMDMNSFVDYFIINEFSKNVDAYRNSAYMYKDKDSIGGKLKMGPVWDFNISLGNSDFYDAGIPQGWEFTYLTTNPSFMTADDYQVPFWWKTLFNDSSFRNKVYARWNELKETIFNTQNINRYIDSCVVVLNEARIRNFTKWPILGTYVWPNNYVGQNYGDEINYMKQFIQTRYTWLNNNMIKGTTGIKDNAEGINKFELYQNYPNPFNPETVIKFSIPSEGHVSLKIFDLLGREIKTIVNEFLIPGVYVRTFTGNSLSAGIYFYKLTYSGNTNCTLTKKLTFLK